VFLDEGEREFIGEFACVTPRGHPLAPDEMAALS
jgi:hypothetical protein